MQEADGEKNIADAAAELLEITAREYYTVIRELPAGKGFADLCFIPRPMHADKPAILIELKWDRAVRGAIAQIRDRQYKSALKAYRGNLLLAGIQYDRTAKRHSCEIEKNNL